MIFDNDANTLHTTFFNSPHYRAQSLFMTFQQLNISRPTLRALEEKNYVSPTPIQQQAIPEAMNGRDIIGIAQTGTGKTAAFAIPIIERLRARKAERGAKSRIRALILTPTRELAIQIEEEFAQYGKYSDLRHTVIYGGVNQKPQTERLGRGTDILIATPGRLLDLIGQGYIDLADVDCFVLDEADRMLDMGFIHDIKRLLPLLPRQKQTLLFSATMPREIVEISRKLLRHPSRVEAAPESTVAETVDQYLYMVEKPDKHALLVDILRRESGKSILVFSRTKHGADKIVRRLEKEGVRERAIHGNKSQNARQQALADFKQGRIHTIVATDIAARGIDIRNLDMVVNYDMPDVAETYVHRIGRTGRAGNSGTAVTFCMQEEKAMLRAVQRLTGDRLHVVAAKSDA